MLENPVSGPTASNDDGNWHLKKKYTSNQSFLWGCALSANPLSYSYTE